MPSSRELSGWEEEGKLTLPTWRTDPFTAADIEQMSLEERLQTLELLWSSLARTPEAVPSPDWHGEVLATRLAKVERGEGEFLSIAQLKQRLHKPAPG